MLIRNIIRAVSVALLLGGGALAPQASRADETANCAPQSGKSCVTKNGNAYSSKICQGAATECVTCEQAVNYVCITDFGDAPDARTGAS